MTQLEGDGTDGEDLPMETSTELDQSAAPTRHASSDVVSTNMASFDEAARPRAQVLTSTSSSPPTPSASPTEPLPVFTLTPTPSLPMAGALSQLEGLALRLAVQQSAGSFASQTTQQLLHQHQDQFQQQQQHREQLQQQQQHREQLQQQQQQHQEQLHQQHNALDLSHFDSDDDDDVDDDDERMCEQLSEERGVRVAL